MAKGSTISAGCVPEIKSLDKMHQYVHVRQIFSMSDEILGSSDILPGYHVILIVSLAMQHRPHNMWVWPCYTWQHYNINVDTQTHLLSDSTLTEETCPPQFHRSPTFPALAIFQ